MLESEKKLSKSCLRMQKDWLKFYYYSYISTFGPALNPGVLFLDLKLSRSARLQIFKHASIIERVITL